jgi:hypothetical protein
VRLVAPWNSDGDAYLTGMTFSGFPVTASAPPCQGQFQDAYAAHLNSAGALIDATYFGAQVAVAHAIALASDGAVWLPIPTDVTPRPLCLANSRRLQV